MIITPKVRNNICMNAHPKGCEKEVLRQIEYVKSRGKFDGPKNVLIIGSSTGYGLASRISAAFGTGANTVGIAFEKEPTGKRPGTPGWYNTRTFDREAAAAGLISISLNGDAFSNEMKAETVKAVKKLPGKIDLIVYSLASPVRTDPATGIMHRSVLKPLGETYTAKAVDAMTGSVSTASIEPANEDELAATIKVMGGEDWSLWTETLLEADVLSDSCMTVAYSYIGPDVTYPVYRSGTIGKAKENLENTAAPLTKKLSSLNGRAFVSVNKALVTRASAVIPVVPLYIALLFKVMKQKGLHEGCIEQMYRLFTDRLYNGSEIPVDEAGRIRLDDREMREDVQAEIGELWDQADSANLAELGDMEGYKKDFLNLHGFEVEGVNYDEDIELV